MLLSGEQMRAARAIARIEQIDLANRANVSVETIKRFERTIGEISANVATVAAVQAALEAAGVIFIPENGAGAGVRLKAPLRRTSSEEEALDAKVADAKLGKKKPKPEG